MSDPNILKLQNTLFALGFKSSINGTLDSDTIKAVKDFQYTWGLPVNGTVDSQTQARLDEAFDMLVSGQWNPEIDPQTYIDTTKPADGSTTGGVIPIVDWKWILLGLGAAILIVKTMGSKKG